MTINVHYNVEEQRSASQLATGDKTTEPLNHSLPLRPFTHTHRQTHTYTLQQIKVREEHRLLITTCNIQIQWHPTPTHTHVHALVKLRILHHV